MTDYLSRQPYLELLKSIIENQKENSTGYSFAIDGEWGSGKTWILQELEKKLLEEKDNKYLIFHYNAWENDFYDEPLVAILSVMIEKLNQITSQKSIYDAVIDELLKQVLADFLTLVSGIVNEVTKIDSEEIIKRKKGFFKRIKENTKLSSKDINSLVPLQHTLLEVRNNLNKLSENFQIILVVDELDRCLPEYAIKVLERLHHVCNEMPVVQILAINKKIFSESISFVFGKTVSDKENINAWKEAFTDNYLQKFVDAVIHLPNGKPDSRLEILNGLEKEFRPYIRSDNIGRDCIKIDDNFLASFISSLMNGVERRLQEKIFKQVALCHELTIKSGIKIEKEEITYAFLIYEILSCISKYVFHSNKQFMLRESTKRQSYILSFSKNDEFSRTFYEEKHDIINSNVEDFFSVPTNQNHTGQFLDSVFIRDTKTYLMAFFSDPPHFSYKSFESHVWDWIGEYKVFLKKYDEIMDMLVVK